MIRIALFLSFLFTLSACQKNTYELANTDTPDKTPQYTVEPERNGVAR